MDLIELRDIQKIYIGEVVALYLLGSTMGIVVWPG